MKLFHKASTVVLTFACILGLAGSAIAATDPGLGAAASFSILAQTAITGASTISGDVGLNSTGAGITALTGANVAGTIYASDLAGPSEALLSASVQANASTAYTSNIPGQGTTGSIGPVLDGLVLTPGVYDIGAGRLNSTLTLNGAGIYIFRASSDFVSSGSILLTNGARACDVFWRIQTLATINGSSFVGTILAGTGVHFGANVTLNGRALAIGGDVTMLTDTISGPTCAAVSTPTPTATPTLTPTPTATLVATSSPLPLVATPTLTPTPTPTIIPALPNTGFGPDNNSGTPWNIIIPAGIFVALLSFFLARKKQVTY